MTNMLKWSFYAEFLVLLCAANTANLPIAKNGMNTDIDSLRLCEIIDSYNYHERPVWSLRMTIFAEAKGKKDKKPKQIKEKKKNNKNKPKGKGKNNTNTRPANVRQVPKSLPINPAPKPKTVAPKANEDQLAASELNKGYLSGLSTDDDCYTGAHLRSDSFAGSDATISMGTMTSETENSLSDTVVETAMQIPENVYTDDPHVFSNVPNFIWGSDSSNNYYDVSESSQDETATQGKRAHRKTSDASDLGHFESAPESADNATFSKKK